MKKLFVDGIQADLKDSNFTIDYTLMDNDDIGGVIAARSTSIDCPVTPTNKKIFAFLDDPTIKKSTALKAANLSDGAFELNGKLRVYEGSKDNYRTQIISTSGDWVTNISTKKINELDFSSDDHVLNKANVDASETFDTSTNFLTRRNYIYPLISYGKTIDTQAVNIVERYPAINLRSIVYKIFQEVGYTVKGTFGAILERLHIPYTGDGKLTGIDDEVAESSLYSVVANDITSTQTIPAGGVNVPVLITKDPISMLKVFDNGGNFNTATDKYTVPFDSTMNFLTVIKSTFNYQYSPSPEIVYSLMKNAAPIKFITTTPIAAEEITLESGYIRVLAGDTIYIKAVLTDLVNNTGVVAEQYTFDIVPTTTTMLNSTVDWYAEGDTVQMSKILPDTLQGSFLKGLLSLYNVIPITDSKRKIVYLNDFNNTFTAKSINWANKIVSKSQQLTMPDPKNYTIGYKEDSSDALYPDKDDFSPYEFTDITATGEESLINSIFAPTLMASDIFMIAGYSDKRPKMWADVIQSTNEGAAYPPAWDTKHDLRILYYAGVKASVDNWIFKATGNEYTRTTYPEMTSYNSTVNLMFRDISGVPGLFKTHWQKRIKQINESPTYSIDVVLSNNDIQGIIDAELNRDGRSPIDLGKLGSFNLLDIKGINTTTGKATLNLIIETKNENSFIPEYAIFADFDGTQFSDFDGVLFSDAEIIN